MTIVDQLKEIEKKAEADEYGEDSFLIKTAVKCLAIYIANKVGPFICGVGGDQCPSTGLHDYYMVCPAYGADVSLTTVYVRSEKSVEDENLYFGKSSDNSTERSEPDDGSSNILSSWEER